MKVEFADAGLARICTDEAHKLGLPIGVIRAARARLLQLEMATDERDLRSLKSLNYKKRKGSDGDVRSIRVNKQYRMFSTISGHSDAVVVTITAIDDPH